MRLSLLGVYNINYLTECTKVLPPHIDKYSAPDQATIDKWLQTTGPVKQITDALMNGDLVTSLVGLLTSLVSGLLG